MPLESRNSSLIPVPCHCGRGLRAKPDQVGTEIRCWNCQRMVLVKIPRDRQHVARAFSDGFLEVVQGPAFRQVLLVALVLTAALSVPRVGVVLAVLVMAVVAAFYGELLARVSRGEKGQASRSLLAMMFPRSILKPLFGLAMAAGTVIPLWFLGSKTSQPPHWTRLGLLIAGSSWLVLPILMLFLYGCDRNGRLGIKKCLGLLVRHPFATVFAIVVVPAFLIANDATLGLIFYLQGNLPFFTLDYMPMPGEPLMFQGIPHYHGIDYRSYPETRFIHAYLDGVRHGYSFSASIPASLSMDIRNDLNPEIIYATRPVYLVIRTGLSYLVVASLITAFAVQAIWLGAIAAVERTRPA